MADTNTNQAETYLNTEMLQDGVYYFDGLDGFVGVITTELLEQFQTALTKSGSTTDESMEYCTDRETYKVFEGWSENNQIQWVEITEDSDDDEIEEQVRAHLLENPIC